MKISLRRYGIIALVVGLIALGLNSIFKPKEETTLDTVMLNQKIIPINPLPKVENYAQQIDNKIITENMFELIPPESNTYEEYLEDLAELEKKIPLQPPAIEQQKQVITALRQLNIELWRSNPKAQSAYETYESALPTASFIDFNEDALLNLEQGDSFKLNTSQMGDMEVIVTNIEPLLNEAKTWLLSDASGKSIGNITRTKEMIEGVFHSPSGQEYRIRAIGGVGWIVSSYDLIMNIADEFKQDIPPEGINAIAGFEDSK